MTRALHSVIAVLLLAGGLYAQTSTDAAELTRLLKEFLAGASRNDAGVHDRFWAEDLIYTGSSGRRIGKSDIMRGVHSDPAPKPGDAATTYSAEDIRIQQYGNTAVLAFRLVGTTERDGKTRVAQYLNSGTFLKRNGTWQVVSWQATSLPRSEEEAKKEVLAADAAFHQALLASDIKRLESLADDSFVLIDRGGKQATRQELLAQVGSRQLKYSKLETESATVFVYGDAAVVRGVSRGQRSAIPGSPDAGDSSSVTSFYTLTFINKAGVWKAVAMHSSQ